MKKPWRSIRNWAIRNALNNLANVLRTQNNYSAAKDMYNECLAIYRDIWDIWAVVYLFEDVAWLAALQGNGQRAVTLRAAASLLREEINAPLSDREAENLNSALEPSLKGLDADELKLAETGGKSMSLGDAISYALS